MNYTTKVTVRHWRIPEAFFYTDTDQPNIMVRWYRKDKDKRNWQVAHEKGGKTEVAIDVFDEHGDPLARFVGVALCSMKDNFCYKLGREIAMGRAFKQFDEWRDKNVVASILDVL